MSKKSASAEKLTEPSISEIGSDQVAAYLMDHPEFFAKHQDLLADLTLPHDSGEAVSLMERQVRILRERGIDARSKLNSLISNARDNDQLFEFTKDTVLALLGSRDVVDIVQVTEDRLTSQDNIDTCELILSKEKITSVPDSIRREQEDELEKIFAKVFRLKRTYCGTLRAEQLNYLFEDSKDSIRSTALCPIVSNDEIFGLLAIGNSSENYFNIKLDTLFLDFIGNVIGAILSRETDNS